MELLQVRYPIDVLTIENSFVLQGSSLQILESLIKDTVPIVLERKGKDLATKNSVTRVIFCSLKRKTGARECPERNGASCKQHNS